MNNNQTTKKYGAQSGKKAIVLLLFLLMLPSLSFSQTSDTKFRKPLKEMIKEVENVFHVTLNFSAKHVDSLWVDYGSWKIQPYDLDKSLARILYPLNLDYIKEGEKTYRIKPYEYPRRSVEEGRKFLQYLSPVYEDPALRQQRVENLKTCIKSYFDFGKFPKPSSKPIVTAKRKMDGYTVENVAIETLPGVYVCGSLYRPLNHKGLSPIVLNPNGHFGNGRYREDMQYRCATQAKMGAIAFNYDLFAWGESLLQFKPEDHHKSIAQTIQVLNNVRILDYLVTLKGADPNRIAITGGSGGGSQTMLMAVIDERVKVSVPVVMTSSWFSGGCPCESGIPFHTCEGGTNNAELAAMAAPKPQLIISDGKDWTSAVPEVEFPFISKIYGYYGAADKIQNVHFPTEGHDYGLSKRLPMYKFLAQYLHLDISRITDKSGKIDESTCTIEPFEALYVFGKNGENLPANAIKSIDKLYEILKMNN